ncbi:extracellular solute-binding protein [Paenibacillus sp. PAMC21692]|uniref:extracellular solute-binding protein n=1 Tax=Paenibacillus sp. PAMC21692 TaxID=2762320 RepID=UPI00164CE3ED|nr:extracellular solute-binding protein [Paenibacillus sp. PAMC21692]QNK59318.1 extracellular solute-binding protein [Paenibacillus sp. PAMC21692]
MKGKVKLIFGLRAGVALLLTAALVGCSTSGGNSPTASPNASASVKPSEPAQTETPAVEKLDKLSYWVYLNSGAAATIKNLGEHEAYKKKQELTGVNVEFIHPQSDEAYNLMMASKDLPDVIESGWISNPGGPEKAIADGKIIRLNEYIDDYAPNLSKLLEENPEMRKIISTDDGTIFAFPFYRGDPFLLTFMGFALRQDWLNNLKLAMPETLDEWHAVLTAFKNDDPNQNGKADEIPLYYKWSDLGFQTAYGITNGLIQEDGVVKHSWYTPQFKEYITLLNKWYSEGLIDQDYLTTDGKLRDAKLTGDQLGAHIQYTVGRYNGLMEGKHPTFEMKAAPYPVITKGTTPIIGHQDPYYTGNGAAVTTSADNIPAIVQWLDFNYGPEGSTLFNFGIEGLTYDMVNGEPVFKEEALADGNLLGRTTLSGAYGPFVQDKRIMEQKSASYKNGVHSLETWMNAENKKHIPRLTLTPDEGSEYASIMNDINTFVKEQVDKFVMGIEPMDKFDAFVATMKDMGMERAIAIQQAAYERYLKR